MLTRAQIKANALDILGEDLGTSGLDRPAMLDNWVNMAADELARATDCYFTSISLDLVAGQAVYSAPGPSFYKVKTAYRIDESFNSRLLAEVTPPELDQRYPLWRTTPKGDPLYYVVEGMNQVRLYPCPDTSSLVYSYTDLVVEPNNTQVTSNARPFQAGDASYTLRVPAGQTGFVAGSYQVVGAPVGGIATLNTGVGTAGSTGGQGVLSTGGMTVEGFAAPGSSWPGASAICPLPEQAHMAVVWRVVMLRAVQFPNPDRYAMAEKEYLTAKRFLEAEAHRQSQATAHADLHRFPFGGGFY